MCHYKYLVTLDRLLHRNVMSMYDFIHLLHIFLAPFCFSLGNIYKLVSQNLESFRSLSIFLLHIKQTILPQITAQNLKLHPLSFFFQYQPKNSAKKYLYQILHFYLIPYLILFLLLHLSSQ